MKHNETTQRSTARRLNARPTDPATWIAVVAFTRTRGGRDTAESQTAVKSAVCSTRGRGRGGCVHPDEASRCEEDRGAGRSFADSGRGHAADLSCSVARRGSPVRSSRRSRRSCDQSVRGEVVTKVVFMESRSFDDSQWQATLDAVLVVLIVSERHITREPSAAADVVGHSGVAV